MVALLGSSVNEGVTLGNSVVEAFVCSGDAVSFLHHVFSLGLETEGTATVCCWV